MSGFETTEILPAAAAENGAEGSVFHTTEQVGAASFSDLVRAHFRREQERATSGRASKDADDDYEAKLERFEKEEGRLGSIYWSTHNASAVALTIGKARHARNPFAETDIDVRLHRVTDWVTRNAEPLGSCSTSATCSRSASGRSCAGRARGSRCSGSIRFRSTRSASSSAPSGEALRRKRR